MNKSFLIFGAAFGMLGVMIGAFGAHALKAGLQAAGNFDTFETAVRYQFYHALVLILTGILSKEFTNKFIKFAGVSFIAGTLIFSGSLYTICFTQIKSFGMVAPIGGIMFVLGWLFLLISFLKKA